MARKGPFAGATRGFRAIRTDFWIHVQRLFYERKGVEGSGYFHKNPEKRFHILGNVLRLIFNLLISPLILVANFFVGVDILNYVKGRAGDFLGFGDDGSDSNSDSDGGEDEDQSEDDDEDEDSDFDEEDEEVREIALPDVVLTRMNGDNTGINGDNTRINGDNHHLYESSGFKPSWLLKVTPRSGASLEYNGEFPLQVSSEGWKDRDSWPPPYIALSYSMASAEAICDAAGLPPPPRPGGKLSWAGRRTISNRFLQLFCEAQLGSGVDPNKVQYIWLDEFCISDARLDDVRDKQLIKTQRKQELGRMADIYRYAEEVALFCHEENCNHTDVMKCAWSQRIYTIAEILNAQNVTTMLVKKHPSAPFTAQLRKWPSAHRFREELQASAAKANNWHLYAIFQQSDHGGAAPMQVVIHALVIEAIRRDEQTGFLQHQELGRALNGLLPRRARIDDLNRGGYADLAWLLELNQAFYNAAALASSCSIISDKDEDGSWLGKPIEPSPGNERLEPIVTAFPIGRRMDDDDDDSDSEDNILPPPPSGPALTPLRLGSRSNLPPGAAAPVKSRRRKFLDRVRFWRRPKTQDVPLKPLATTPKVSPTPPLMIINAHTLTLEETLKRDPQGLHTNKEDMRGFKNLFILLLGTTTAVVAAVIVIILISGADRHDIGLGWELGILIPVYVGMVLYQFLELLVGTIYIKREGWIFLESAEWVEGENALLGQQDSNLKKLVAWGSRQLIPVWEAPRKDPQCPDSFVATKPGKLVDLSTGVCVDALVTSTPDIVVPLAIHGSGVTCMLLKRRKKVANKPTFRARKVGMANFPTYVLSQMDKEIVARTIIVGSRKNQISKGLTEGQAF